MAAAGGPVGLLQAVAREELARMAFLRRLPSMAGPGDPPAPAPPAGQVAGPFSPLGRLDSLSPALPEWESALRAPREPEEGWSLQRMDRRARSQLQVTGAGVYHAEAWLQTDAPATALWVHGRTDGGMTLFVDGEPVLWRSATVAQDTVDRINRVVLGPGTHRVLLRMAAATGLERWSVQLGPEPGGGTWAWVDPPSTPSAARALGQWGTGLRPREVVAAAGIEDAGWRWLALAELALGTQDGDLALALMTEPWARDWDHPLSLLLRAELAPLVRIVPPALTEDQRLTTLRQGLEAWPGAHGLRLALARALDRNGQPDEALALVTPVLDALPDEPTAWITAAGLYASRGWPALARQAWQQAARLAPGDCRVVDALLDALEVDEVPLHPDRFDAAWLQCEQGRLQWARHWWVPRGAFEEAAAAIAPSDPTSSDQAVLRADLAMARGDHAAAADLLRAARDLGLSDGDWLAVDAATTEADLEATVAAFQAHVDAHPHRLYMRIALGLLQGGTALEGLRVDGMDVVRRYLDEAPAETGALVLVHDYAATRYFENGASVDVVHTIQRVRTRDALESEGEVGVPEGAVVLTVRTIKPDGRTFTPVDIPGKTSISMPFLEQGDFIELEYVTGFTPQTDRPVRQLSPRFYFRIPDGPMFESTVRYLYPASWAREVIFDARVFDGTRTDDEPLPGVRATTFSVRHSPEARAEPFAPSGDDWVPSVRFVFRRDWAHVTRNFAELVLGSMVDAGGLDSTLREVVSGARTPRERARALFRFATDEFDSTSAWFRDPAVWTLTTGEGDRAALLFALLEHAGLRPTLAFVRTAESSQWDTTWANDGEYDLMAIRVMDGRNEIWLEPDWDEYPFDYLRPEAQGQPALLVVGPGAGQRVQTPVWPMAQEVSRMDLTLTMQADGSARADIVEQVGMRQAPAFRSAIRRTADPQEIARLMERSLGSELPGIRIESWSIDNLDDHDAQPVLRYAAVVPRWGRPEGEGAVQVESRFGQTDLVGAFAATADRRLPLRIPFALHRAYQARVIPPPGWRIELDPRDTSGTVGPLSWRRRLAVDRDGHGIIAWAFDLPVSEMPADDYEAWARGLRDHEAGARMRLRIVADP
jgi:hypothetical protein